MVRGSFYIFVFSVTYCFRVPPAVYPGCRLEIQVEKVAFAQPHAISYYGLGMWFVLVLGATPWASQIARRVTLRPYKASASSRVQPHPKAFLSEDAVLCSVPSSGDCKWVLIDGKCSPACRNVNCGLVSCNCEPVPSLERPPWWLLDVSYESCPQNVQEAFVATAVQLQPDKNAGCVDQARHELVAARKARDVLLEFVTTNLAAGGSCDSEAEASAVSDPWTKLEDMGGSQQPLLLSAWRSTRRWLGERMRVLRKKAVQHSPWLALAGAIAIQALAVMGLV